MGVVLLNKAFRILLYEGERQIRLRDVAWNHLFLVCVCCFLSETCGSGFYWAYCYAISSWHDTVVCLSVCLCHSAQRQRQINRRHYDGSIWYYCMQQYNRLKNSCNNNAKGLYINVSFHQVCTNRCIPDYTTFTFVFNGNIVDFWKYFYLQAHVIIMYNYVSCVWEICDQLQLQFLTIVWGLFNPQCKGGERPQNFEHTPNAELYSSNVQPNWNM